MNTCCLEMATIIIGSFAAISAFSMSVYFRKAVGVGRAVAIDKLAEAVNITVILVFAIAYYLRLFEVMPVYMATTLRLFAFAATLGSSIHLAWQTKKVLEDSDLE